MMGHVKSDAKVKKGDLLVSFDMAKIKKSGYQVTIPMIICNSDDYINISTVREGTVNCGEEILKLD